MWLFRSANDDEDRGWDAAASEAETGADSEAEELRLKEEALRMAEYREQMRAAVASSSSAAAPASPSPHDRVVRSPPPEVVADRSDALRLGNSDIDRMRSASSLTDRTTSGDSMCFGSVEHYKLDDSRMEGSPMNAEDLESMYDFSRFHPVADFSSQEVETALTPPRTPVSLGDGRTDTRSSSLDSGKEMMTPKSQSAEQRRLRMVEATLQEREREMEARMEAQDKKLAAASRALQKTRCQVQQLTAQLGLKDLEGNKLETQVGSLRNLLVEKERRLQDALDEACEVMAGPVPSRPAGPRSIQASPTSPTSSQVTEDGTQQPQEPPVGACGSEAAVDEEQVTQLVHITEELTGALEAARESEEIARRQLMEATARLQQEQQQRERFEQEFEASKAEQAAELAALRSQLEAQERAIEAERRRGKELAERNARLELEECLKQALTLKKGKSFVWHPHIEI